MNPRYQSTDSLYLTLADDLTEYMKCCLIEIIKKIKNNRNIVSRDQINDTDMYKYVCAYCQANGYTQLKNKLTYTTFLSIYNLI